IAFFRERKGKAIGFRFKDHTDFEAKNEKIGIGDGKNERFQLIKIYGKEKRIITKPVKDTVRIYTSYRSTILVKEINTQINYINGQIIFDKPPQSGTIIIASFEFDIPVRFDTDALSISMDDYNSFSWSDISLVELKL
ncbi:DUF2460 domain-containing protein, partial [Rickettsia endosymbiont of Cardiosporidium cionae]|uniref:DUF2460 domain-containing protein n=1 Tax=Rickettsia endosymbiont of Cardiosporidium cionae TaxID=2777155 RepID=UPI0018962421